MVTGGGAEQAPLTYNVLRFTSRPPFMGGLFETQAGLRRAHFPILGLQY
jgi:hypothetical protein